MSCIDSVCGTGGWTGPLPGDPDNNSLLTATPAFGGIDVSWTYPTINAHAVAHTILYRAIIPDFLGAVRRSTVAGNLFYDKTTGNVAVKYYYWIQIVSVNGTVGALIGPASATARPTIEQTIEQLTGKIDAGVLAQSLKTEISNISLLGNSITQEVTNRKAANTALLGVLGTVQSSADSALTFVEKEVTQRKTADLAIVESLELLAAGFDTSVAGLAEEIIIKAGPDSALAKKITTLEASVDGNTVTGQIGLSAEVDKLTGVLGGMYTAKISVDGLIGGFGIYNDGREVEAGFDVDRFWVGRTGATGRKPFIIEGTEVFIDKAAINQLTFSTIRNESGSIMGTAEGKLKAQFIETEGLAIKDATGTIVLSSGDGKFSGDLEAAGGTFKGKLTADALNAVSTINISDNAVTVPIASILSERVTAQYGSTTYTYSSTRNLGSITTSLNGRGQVVLQIYQNKAIIQRDNLMHDYSEGIQNTDNFYCSASSDWFAPSQMTAKIELIRKSTTVTGTVTDTVIRSWALSTQGLSCTYISTSISQVVDNPGKGIVCNYSIKFTTTIGTFNRVGGMHSHYSPELGVFIMEYRK